MAKIGISYESFGESEGPFLTIAEDNGETSKLHHEENIDIPHFGEIDLYVSLENAEILAQAILKKVSDFRNLHV